MREKPLTERECDQMIWLAKKYEAQEVGAGIPREDLGEIVENQKELDKLIERLQGLGAMTSISNFALYLNDEILYIARTLQVKQRELKRPQDRVDQIIKFFRTHWITAILIAILLAVSFSVVLVNQTWELVLKFHPNKNDAIGNADNGLKR